MSNLPGLIEVLNLGKFIRRGWRALGTREARISNIPSAGSGQAYRKKQIKRWIDH